MVKVNGSQNNLVYDEVVIMIISSGYIDVSDEFCYYAWLDPNIYEEATEWTIHQFGKPLHNYGDYWCKIDDGTYRWRKLHCTFFFKHEEDKNWFVLRWS